MSDTEECRVWVRMSDKRIVDLLELLYVRGYVMFGEDKEIERLIRELREDEE